MIYDIVRRTQPFRIARFLKQLWFPAIFHTVAIETTTICNRKCSYCPNASVGRTPRLMEESVFLKIIASLKDIGFGGSICFNGYGEPLTDNRLAQFVSHAKTMLPGVSMMVNTNGDFLTLERYAEISNAGMDCFSISVHSDKLPESTETALEAIAKQFPSDKKIVYNNVFNSDLKTNRGGLVDVKTIKRMECTYPSLLTFDYAGNIILCCCDYNSTVIFGNINDDKLQSIWFNKKYVKIRSQIYVGYFPYEMCRKCCA